MKRLLLACTLTAAGVTAQNLDPVAFLAGTFEGVGKHQWGEYRETLVGKWELGGQILTVRSKSTMQGQTVFEDLRVLSYDPASKRIRMRQYGLGDLAVYDVTVAADGSVVCTETGHEGSARPEWRYTFNRDGDGFKYRVEAKGKRGFAPHVSGVLAPRLADPGEQGKLPRRIERKKVAGLDVELHVPQGDGPFPTVIFSPGGAATSTQGYATFGRWFASWGMVTAVVAFKKRDPAERAELFQTVADALADDERVDAKRLAAGGHSLGGHAALLAAHGDPRFVACLALAPSGPAEVEAKKGPPTLVVCGTSDDLLKVAQSLGDALPGPRYVAEIEGMNHMFHPSEAGMKVLGRATAFLLCHLAGDERYRGFLVGAKDGVRVRHAK